MSKDFEVQILTPYSTLFTGQATEVVLPAYDGEVGILAGHGDFIGTLGTGPLKLVRDGDDYWYVLSSGAYRVDHGKLTILAEFGEKPQKEFDVETLTARMKEIEAALADSKPRTSDEYQGLKNELDQVKARLEVHRRTELVN